MFPLHPSIEKAASFEEYAGYRHPLERTKIAVKADYGFLFMIIDGII